MRQPVSERGVGVFVDDKTLTNNNIMNGGRQPSAFQPPTKRSSNNANKSTKLANGGGERSSTPQNGRALPAFAQNGHSSSLHYRHRHPHNEFANNNNEMTPTGKTKQPSAERWCECCPYGFHIDLGFVKFAEEVATGQLQNWSSPSKRARNIITSPVPSSFSPLLNSVSEFGVGGADDSGSLFDVNNSSSLHIDSSFVSNEPTSELDEILQNNALSSQHAARQQPPLPSNTTKTTSPKVSTKALNKTPQSILKNVVLQNQNQNNNRLPTADSQPNPNTAAHYARPHQSRGAFYDSMPRRFTTATSATAGGSRTLDSSTMPHPLRTSTPASKTYYTAIAQSMAQLKQIPPRKGNVQHYHSNTLNNHRTASSTNNGAAQMVPYRTSSYLEKRQRVLSPEPVENSNPSSFLRHSNLQSRSYFHGSGCTNFGNNGFISSNNTHTFMPYRGFGGVATAAAGSVSSLFDGFASVRRKRIDEAAMPTLGYHPFATATTPELFRSLSPPRHDFTPNWSEAASSADAPRFVFDLKPDQDEHFYNNNFGRHRRSQTLSPIRIATYANNEHHHTMEEFDDAVFCNKKNSYSQHSNNRGVALAENVKMHEIHVQTTPQSLQNAETQTFTKMQSVGTLTLAREEAPKKKVKMVDAFTLSDPLILPIQKSIAVDTRDLPTPPAKKVPPPPPPKPKEVNLVELRKRNLDMSFQYCIGHEPEHHPDEVPPYIAAKKAAVIEISSLPVLDKSFEMTDRGCSPIEFENVVLFQKHHLALKQAPSNINEESNSRNSSTIAIQTDSVDILNENERKISALLKFSEEAAAQTESAWLDDEIKRLVAKEEKALKRRSVDKITETDDTGGGVAGDEFIMITCGKCDQRSSLEIDGDGELYEKIFAAQGEAGGGDDVNRADEHDLTLPLFVHHQTPPKSPQKSPPSLPTIDEELSSSQGLLLLAPSLSKTQELPHLPPIPCVESFLQNKLNDDEEFADEEEEEEVLLLPEVDDGDPDRVSIDTDVQTVIMAAQGVPVVAESGRAESRCVDSLRVDAVRKLLTEEQRSQPFKRGAVNYRSYRLERGKGNDLDYIAERHANKNDVLAEPSTPSSFSNTTSANKKALKEMVNLKKTYSNPNPTSFIGVPEPIPAKIPRPKFSKYSPGVEHAETPDEAEEAADRLTPLRSEMRSLTSWGSPRLGQNVPHLYFKQSNLSNELISFPGGEDEFAEFEGRYGSGGEECIDDKDDEDASSSSSEGTRTYDMSEHEECLAIRFENDELELSTPLRDALEMINNQLLHGTPGGHSADWALKYTQHEWFKLATKRNANPELVEAFLFTLEGYSALLMSTIVNMKDQNRNMALHYAVSHENYEVVSVLLDSKVCKVDEMNKAGYSPVMLGALCELKNETEMAIIERLFQMGNVNEKALEHQQTALMLAASHGRVETTNLLIKHGGEVNIQDADGSTALMFAAEYGQKDIVKILLKQPDIDASLTDCDNQTALSIAVDSHHRDIGVLIYAHLNFSRLEHNDNSVAV